MSPQAKLVVVHGYQETPGEVFREKMDVYVIHELAHLWHHNLPQQRRHEFEQRWNEISQEWYHYQNNTQVFPGTYYQSLASAVSYNGAENILEHVAETTAFVYHTNLTNTTQSDFFEIDYCDFNRLAELIGILREFGFISQYEANKSISIVEAK